MKWRWALLAVLLGAWPHASFCGEDGDPFEGALHEATLRTFHPTDAVIATDHGESRIQFLLSLACQVLPMESLDWHVGSYRLSALNFAYDSLYDYHISTRYSEPVVSRLQNPGFYFSVEAPRSELQAGWFHESNGQVIDTHAALLAAGPHGQDFVSRAWDYWYLSSAFRLLEKPTMRFSFVPTLRIFTGAQGIIHPTEQDIFWRPSDPPSAIADYDGLRGQFLGEWLFPHRICNYLGLSAEFRTGYHEGHFASNWSRRFELTLKTWHIPWYLYYTNGYGPYISDYSSWSEGYGFGVRIW
ncbi:MAG: hypothetical protein V4498_08295 [candidate division FCPU426 bacterium]